MRERTHFETELELLLEPQPDPRELEESDPDGRWQALRERIVAVAEAEYERWGRGTVQETDPGITTRLRDYWVRGAGRSAGELTDQRLRSEAWQRDNPWSAAFISWVMVQAGAGGSFPRSFAHRRYIRAAKRNRLNGSPNPFWAFRVSEVKPQVGDLICNSRCSQKTRRRGLCGANYDNVLEDKNWPTHGDIVTEVRGGFATVIGGNTEDRTTRKSHTVGKKRVRLDDNGFVQRTGNPERDYIAIITTRSEARTVPIGPAPTTPPASTGPASARAPAQGSLDVQRAIRLNRRYAERLGWQAQQIEIGQLLGFTDMSPGERAFAEAVYGWQQRQGLSADGVIGPETWARMQRALRGQSAPVGRFELQRAIRLNRSNGRRLGWALRQADIQQLLGFTDTSPSERAFAEAVADWQQGQGLTPDGIIGSNTWARMQQALRGGIDPTHQIDLERAVQLNRDHGQRLGWAQRRGEIERLLGYTDTSPGERAFAQGVADWQQSRGYRATGLLDEATWRVMSATLQQISTLSRWDPLPASLEPELARAVTRFRKLLEAELTSGRLDRAEAIESRRILCRVRMLTRRGVDDRLIGKDDMCGRLMNQHDLFGVSPCSQERERQLLQAGVRTRQDVDSAPRSLFLIQHLKSYLLENHMRNSDDFSALTLLKILDSQVDQAINLLFQRDAVQRNAGYQRLPVYYIAIKDWIADRQRSQESVYSCR